MATGPGSSGGELLSAGSAAVPGTAVRGVLRGAAPPGGAVASLIYKPTGREHFMPEMLDPEDVRRFELPDELFASFPMESAVAGSDG